MSEKVTVTIEIEGHSVYVTESDMITHLEDVAKWITEYAERLPTDDYHRKISIDWDVQEYANLSIKTTTVVG